MNGLERWEGNICSNLVASGSEETIPAKRWPFFLRICCTAAIVFQISSPDGCARMMHEALPPTSCQKPGEGGEPGSNWPESDPSEQSHSLVRHTACLMSGSRPQGIRLLTVVSLPLLLHPLVCLQDRSAALLSDLKAKLIGIFLQCKARLNPASSWVALGPDPQKASTWIQAQMCWLLSGIHQSLHWPCPQVWQSYNLIDLFTQIMSAPQNVPSCNSYHYHLFLACQS